MLEGVFYFTSAVHLLPLDMLSYANHMLNPVLGLTYRYDIDLNISVVVC